jgi:hypothetical protein
VGDEAEKGEQMKEPRSSVVDVALYQKYPTIVRHTK